ncbi:MAG: phytoene/squalene synthase family protein [Deltaproteobacteria bacterium]|nr:phytoene/squalene synthase family protein [Deltaproteobacteria bacterium]
MRTLSMQSTRTLAVRADDLAHCQALLRAGSKSFSAASRLLPEGVRHRATVLYAFCRVADDRIDDDPAASRATLEAMRARLDRAYAGRPDDDPVDRALAALLEDTPIPRALPYALFEGMQWDLEGRRYETLEELYDYAARVAGTVGVMMTLVMGGRDEDVLARACDLGVAMQLTNVARDVGEDARRGRLYLPMAWMKRAGIDPDAFLRHPEPSASLVIVVRDLLSHASALYERADHGIPLLPHDCRMAIRAARLVYSAIGDEIAAASYDSVTRRAVVPSWRKMLLVARSGAARWAKHEPLDTPALEATRCLVEACMANGVS